tara:strand:- start:567 stop:1133 length:567 start_codon:yes stop_codon:yes gene_type:complete
MQKKSMLTTKQIVIPIFIALLSLQGCSLFDRGANDRTPGTMIDDEFIERIASREINKSDPLLKAANINIVSFNGLVLLTGQIQDSQLSRKTESVVRKIRKVRKVHNELQIGSPISLVARTNDAWLTTKIRAKLLAETNINNTNYKVVTENGIVFLMGFVSKSDSKSIVEIARNVFGVQKVVKVFEYVD